MQLSRFIDNDILQKRVKTKQNSFALNLAIINHIKKLEYSGVLKPEINQFTNIKTHKETAEVNLDYNILKIKRASGRTLECANKYELYYEKDQYRELTDSDLITRYCKSRSCLTCLRNKTADLINGYQHLNDKQTYFVTLTLRNCYAQDLLEVLHTMHDIMRRLQDRIRKVSKTYSGVRKLEITHNETDNTYHPHFHIIVNDEITGDFIVNEWRKLTKKYLNHLELYSSKPAQDIKQCSGDGKDFLELCKYFTKLYKEGQKHINIPAFTNIIAALRKLRVIQTFGHISKIRTENDFTRLSKIDDYYIEFFNQQYVLLNSHAQIDTFLSPVISADKIYKDALKNNHFKYEKI